MSSGKRFDKTFSRKKKENEKNNDTKKEEDEVLSTLINSQRKPETPKIHNNGSKSKIIKKSTSKSKQEKKEAIDSPKPKQKLEDQEKQQSKIQNPKDNEGKHQTLEQKRKVENGGGHKEDVKVKKQKTTTSTMTTKVAKNQKKELDEGKEKEKEESSEYTFPMNRIVRIIKSEGSDYRLSQEATFLVNKAMQKFIELFSEDAYGRAVEDHKSFVGYKHLSSVVCKEKRFDFLSDFVPEKVAAEKALAERKTSRDATTTGVAS